MVPYSRIIGNWTVKITNPGGKGYSAFLYRAGSDKIVATELMDLPMQYWFKSLRVRMMIAERVLFAYAAEIEKQEFMAKVDGPSDRSL